MRRERVCASAAATPAPSLRRLNAVLLLRLRLLLLLRPLGMERAGLVGPLVGVRAEQVALGLDQVRREPLAAVAVVVGQGGREGRDGDAQPGGLADDPPPAVLALPDGLGEVGGQQQVRQVPVLVVGVLDAVQEAGADDASPRQMVAISPGWSCQPCSWAAASIWSNPWA